MNKVTQTDPQSGSLDLVIEWLGGHDQEKIDKATSILLSVGQPVAEYLVLAATKRGRRPEHVCRLLDIVRQIGGPLEPDEMFGLQTLLSHRDPDVCEKTEQVIMAASPCGVPDSPEGIAMLRAFNPFLQTPRRGCGRSQGTDILAAMRGDPAAIQRRARYNAPRPREEEREQRGRS